MEHAGKVLQLFHAPKRLLQTLTHNHHFVVRDEASDVPARGLSNLLGQPCAAKKLVPGKSGTFDPPKIATI